MGMLPKVGPFANLPKNTEIDEKRLTSVEAIINSMTAAERADDRLIDGKRRKRIARGSGTSVQEVNQVLKQYSDMRRMMKQYGSYAKTKMRGLGKFAGMKPPPGLAGEEEAREAPRQCFQRALLAQINDW